MNSMFHYHIRVGDSDTERSCKVVSDFLAAMAGVSNVLSLCNRSHEAAMVEIQSLQTAAATVEELIATVGRAEHIVWVLWVNGVVALDAITALLTSNEQAPENLCVAIRPPQNLTTEQVVMDSFEKCPVKHKALISDGSYMPVITEWKKAGANWVILEAEATHESRGLIRAECHKAILPLLELGFDASDSGLRPHPFPNEWGVDFTRPGVQGTSANATAPAMGSISPPESAVVPEVLPDVARHPCTFHDLDARVRTGIDAGIEAAFALHEIREKQLWHDGGYPSWNAYCESLLSVSRSYVNRLIAHAKITEELGNHMPPKDADGHPVLPAGEAQSRPLKRLKQAKQRAKAWRSAVKTAGGSMPTQNMVADAVATLIEPKSPSKLEAAQHSKCRRFIEGLRAAAESCREREHVLHLLAELETALQIQPNNTKK